MERQHDGKYEWCFKAMRITVALGMALLRFVWVAVLCVVVVLLLVVFGVINPALARAFWRGFRGKNREPKVPKPNIRKIPCNPALAARNTNDCI